VGSVGVGDAARQVRMRATMIVFGMASGIYQKLRDHCSDIVAALGGVPDPPADVWEASTIAEASTAMIRHNREQDWAKFVRLSETWSNIHSCARLLRETNQFESQLHFDGAPTDLGLIYLNWQAVVGKKELRQLAPPLRVRRAHDLGWSRELAIPVEPEVEQQCLVQHDMHGEAVSCTDIGVVELLGREGDRTVNNGRRGCGGRASEQRDRASHGGTQQHRPSCPCEVRDIAPQQGLIAVRQSCRTYRVRVVGMLSRAMEASESQRQSETCHSSWAWTRTAPARRSRAARLENSHQDPGCATHHEVSARSCCLSLAVTRPGVSLPRTVSFL
jgi:hypothetical protein